MRTLENSEVAAVSGGAVPLVVAAMWLGRAGAVGGLISTAYYFYSRP